jgi:N-acyl-D-aspartate/D-glutamate deacylase
MRTVLRGATVVDGTGAPARRADVEVVDARIGAVGDVAADGSPVVDLSGLALCPGFVDVHTHLDAQVFWDPDLTPSSWHGVTTVVQGNCGFGIAPARPEDRDLIMDTLELVEGMNVNTLRAGIDWRFETFPEYLGVLRSLPKRINIAPMVPHSMVRLYVMGEEAVFSRAASDEERAAIKALVLEGLRAGAIGVTTSQAPSHQGPHGRPVPSRLADRREIEALVEALAEHGRGIAEITYGPVYEIEDIARLSKDHGVRITWGSVIPGLFGGPGAAMDMLDRGAAAGGDVWPQTSTRFITTQMSLLNPYQWSRVPAFKEVLGRAPDVKAKAYRDPEWRARAKQQTDDLAVESDFLDGDIEGYFRRISVAETSRHQALVGAPIADLARQRGQHPLDVMLDLALEDDLQTRFRHLSRGTYEELRDLVTDQRAVLGAHDAGAHVDMLCDSCYPSYTLRYWVREERAMTLEEAVWRLCGQPASIFGIPDRGVVAPGKAADLVAFDPERVGETPQVRVYDFPAGGDRLVSDNVGIEHVWVGGRPVRREGAQVEGAYPGVLVAG